MISFKRHLKFSCCKFKLNDRKQPNILTSYLQVNIMTWSVFHVKYYVSMFSTATQVFHSVVYPSAQRNYNICYFEIDQCLVVFGNGCRRMKCF